MELDLHATRLAVCRLHAEDAVPGWADRAFRPLLSITRTAGELSIVLPQVEPGWRALSVRGPLPFHVTGILASLADPLADAGVPTRSGTGFDWLILVLTAIPAIGAVGAVAIALGREAEAWKRHLRCCAVRIACRRR